MKKCEKAKREIQTRGLAIILLAGYDSWKCNDFNLNSIIRRSIEYGKYAIKHDKKTQEALANYIACKIS
jgi:hypothetical protein